MRRWVIILTVLASSVALYSCGGPPDNREAKEAVALGLTTLCRASRIQESRVEIILDGMRNAGASEDELNKARDLLTMIRKRRCNFRGSAAQELRSLKDIYEAIDSRLWDDITSDGQAWMENFSPTQASIELEMDRFERNCSPPDTTTWANMNSSEFEESFSSIANGSCPDSDYANNFSSLPRDGFRNCMTEFSEAFWDGRCSSPVAGDDDFWEETRPGTYFWFQENDDGTIWMIELNIDADGNKDFKIEEYNLPDDFLSPGVEDPGPPILEPIIIELPPTSPGPTFPDDGPRPGADDPDDNSSVSMSSDGGLSVTGGNIDGIGAGSGGCGRYQPVDGASASYFISNYTHAAYPDVPTEERGEIDAFTTLLHCQCQSVSSLLSGQQRVSLGCPKTEDEQRMECLRNPFGPDDAPKQECIDYLRDDNSLYSSYVDRQCEAMFCPGDQFLAVRATTGPAPTGPDDPDFDPCVCIGPGPEVLFSSQAPSCAAVQCPSGHYCQDGICQSYPMDGPERCSLPFGHGTVAVGLPDCPMPILGGGVVPPP